MVLVDFGYLNGDTDLLYSSLLSLPIVFDKDAAPRSAANGTWLFLDLCLTLEK